MNPSSSEEHPQFCARSPKTPESPRPVHVPEPSNIPVLENQTDPIFNLMTTHLNPPFAARNMTAIDHEMAQLSATQDASALAIESGREDQNQETGGEVAGQSTESMQVTRMLEDASEAASPSEIKKTADHQHQTEGTLDDKQSSTSSSQPSAALGNLESVISSMTNNPQPSHPFPQTVSETYASPPNPIDPSALTQLADRSQETNVESYSGAEVNYQALLDNIVSPKTSEPTAANNTTVDTSQTIENTNLLTPSITHNPPPSLPTPAGLPPRPPPQEKPAVHPNHAPGQDIPTYHFSQPPHTNPQPNPSSTAAGNAFRPPLYNPNLMSAPIAGPGSNGLPPPPMPSFQKPQLQIGQSDRSPSGFSQEQEDLVRNSSVPRPERGSRDDEQQWPKEIQGKYDQFLRDEEVYTKEGAWDKFPRGSRLFVGNLPTEIVTKRDVFHVFHRFGRLAQISIKQAYGFVQFMDKEACDTALRTEQNGKIKDRNMHLEVSKPPKNSRNQASAAGEQLRASHYRRSRSPDRRPNSRGQRDNDRFPRSNLPFSDYREEPSRRRDDYRPIRSPSPRGFRARDNYRGGRERSPTGYRGGRERSRSPYGRAPPRYNRSPSPRRRNADDDDILPIPKRLPRDVPDVQILLLDDLDRGFVEYIERGFRDRNLRVGVLLMPNVSLQAIIRRQILEGVHAVVKLARDAMTSGRVSIQIFDRSAGASNVRFEGLYLVIPSCITSLRASPEYAEALPTAAELVVRTKAKQASTLPAPQAPFTSSQQQAFAALQQYGIPIQQLQQIQPQQQQAIPPPQQQQQPNLANLISTLDGPALQKVLNAMQQSPQQQQQTGMPQPSPTTPQQQPDLQALLGQLAKQQAAGAPHTPVTPQSAGFPTGGAGYPPPQHQQQATATGYGQYGATSGYPQHQPQQQQQQQHPQGRAYPQPGPQQYILPSGTAIGAQGTQVQAMLDQITRGVAWKQ